MPAIYAHYRFGNDVLDMLPHEIADNITNIELFSIGLCGPDFFFYHNPLGHSPIQQVAHDVHFKPARSFFEYAVSVFPKDPARLASDAYSYLCGFVCHYTLDFFCHSYIEQKIRVSHVSHTDIEADFERYLLLKDGKNPILVQTSSHLRASDYNISVLARFFPDVSELDVGAALRRMLFYERCLYAPVPWKRRLLYTLFRLLGCYRTMRGHVMPEHALPECRDSSMRLEKLYKLAMPRAAQSIQELTDVLFYGGTLSAAFDHTFEAEGDFDAIPVFNYKEELHYEPKNDIA